MTIYTSFYHAFIRDSQRRAAVFNIHCSIVFHLRIITVVNRQYTTQT